MKNKNKNKFMIVLALSGLFATLGISSWAHENSWRDRDDDRSNHHHNGYGEENDSQQRHHPGGQFKDPEILELTKIELNPSFLIAGQPNRITVKVKVSEDSPIFPSDELILEQQQYLFNGASAFFPIAELNDNNRNGDLEPGDGIFSGKVRLNEKVTGNVQLRVVSKKKRHKHFFYASSPFSIPVQHACGPTGTILPVKIFDGKKGQHEFDTVEFDVPNAGKAVLRLVNGAQVGATSDSRFFYSKVSINGNHIKTLKKIHNVAELRVNLLQGKNQLNIDKVVAKSNQRLSARIDACADNLELKPVTDSLKVGDVLQTEATVTSLGMPVENANVKFDLTGIGPDQTSTEATSGLGTKAISFPIQATGSGWLRAEAIDSNPLLKAEIPVNAIAQASIFIGQGRPDYTINTQEESYIPFFLYYVNQGSAKIIFEQKIKPSSDDGVTYSTNPKLVDDKIKFEPTGPNIFSIDGTIKALTSGNYTITSTATIDDDTQETTSSSLNVTVIDPAAPEPLGLGTPSANPPAVNPTNEKVRVTFLSLVSGTSTPPNVLFLDKVDTTGKLLAEGIAQLNDVGQGSDVTSGDYAYTGSLELDAFEPEERNYRVRAEYFDKTVTSGVIAFGVTPFPLEPRPSNPATLIKDLKDGGQIYANEVIAQFLPNVNSDRIDEIASNAGAKVVGAIPTLRTYLLEIPGNESFSSLQQTIMKLNNFSEVKKASVNELPIPLAFPNDPPNDPGYNSACPNGGQKQWYLDNIKAPGAWKIAGGGNSTHSVAIIDYGVNCAHSDLSGQCGNTDAASSAHGTQLAGIVAANTDNTEGISGVAYSSKIYEYPFIIGSAYNFTEQFVNTTLSGHVRVINISQAVQSNPSGMSDAINRAIQSGRLVVVASGNPTLSTYPTCQQPNLYPASYSIGDGFLVIGATDETNNLATGYDGGRCSNRTNVELYAPGKNICTTDTNSTNYSIVSGTSFATALTSGAAAVYWATKASSLPAEVENRLKNKADDISLGSTTFGTGKRLNLESAVLTKEVKINFKYDGADYRNIFGYYFKDTGEAHVLLDDVNNVNNSLDNFESKFSITQNQLNNLEFFIIPGGKGAISGTNINNGINTDNLAFFSGSIPTIQRKLSVFQDSDLKWRVKDTRGDNIATNDIILRGVHDQNQSSDAFFSQSTLNPGGVSHLRNLTPMDYNNTTTNCKNANQITAIGSEFVACWEDLDKSTGGQSDEDYDDAVFSITVTNI